MTTKEDLSISLASVLSEHYAAERRGRTSRGDVWLIIERRTNRQLGRAIGRDAAVEQVLIEEDRHEENLAKWAERDVLSAAGAVLAAESKRASAERTAAEIAAEQAPANYATDRQVDRAMKLLARALRSGALDLDGYDYERLRRMSRSEISAFISRLTEQY